MEFSQATVVASIDNYEVVNNDYVSYTIRVGLAGGGSVPWSVVRRFEDFESLLWALKPQGPPWSQHRMPPTRWFNKHEPSFLQERQVLLQAMLESMLSQSLPPAPLRQFLEVDGHIDLADLERLADEVQASGGRGLGQGLGGEGSGHDRAAAALAESYRLQGIVNNTLASLIDVSLSDPSEMLLDANSLQAQRKELLEVAGTSDSTPAVPANAKKSGVRRALPVGSASVASLDSLLDTLSKPTPVEAQNRLVERYGLILADSIRMTSSVDTGAITEDLVCHLHFTPTVA